MTVLLAVGALAFAVSAATARLLISPFARLLRLDTIDVPNARSLHSTPTPRTGGLAVAAGVAAALVVFRLTGHSVPQWLLVTLVCTGLVAALSIVDDRRGLSPLVRFSLQLVIAGALVGSGLVIPPLPLWRASLELGWAAPIITVIFVVWMGNLYNFMDGMDGLAGTMTLIGFLCAVTMAGTGEAHRVVCVGVAAAAAGFLTQNLPPAAIFMGDVGSVPIGFLAGALATRAAQARPFNLYVFLLIFSPFVVDATIVVLRRLARGEAIWRAHRTHIYQRLVLAGWSVPRTLTAEAIVMALSSASALVAVDGSSLVRISLFAAWAVIYTLLYFLVGTVEHRESLPARSRAV